MALRQSVILGRYAVPEAPGLERINVVFWIPVAVGAEEPLPGFKSAVIGAAFDGNPQGPAPSSAETAALQLGQIREITVQPLIPASYTQAQSVTFINSLRAAIVTGWVAPGRSYGAYQDDQAAWHNRP